VSKLSMVGAVSFLYPFPLLNERFRIPYTFSAEISCVCLPGSRIFAFDRRGAFTSPVRCAPAAGSTHDL